MTEPLFVQQIKLRAPLGFREAVQEAAREQGQTTSEYIRQAVRAKMNGPVQVPAEQAAGAGD